MTTETEWVEWTNSNLTRGCDPLEIAMILSRNGFSYLWIQHVLGNNFPSQAFEKATRTLTPGGYARLANRPFTRLNPKTLACAHPDIWKFPNERIQLYSWNNFLSDEICDRLIAIADRKLRPSTVMGDDYNGTYRSSQTCDLPEVDEALSSELDQLISSKLDLNNDFSEAIQIQKYEPGQEFKQHTDFFDPGGEHFERECSAKGQRSWTCMIYLNDDMSGGETEFVNLKKLFSRSRVKP